MIFAEALEQADPQERVAFLVQACGADVKLRRRIEALIRSHEQAQGFLQSPALAGEVEGGAARRGAAAAAAAAAAPGGEPITVDADRAPAEHPGAHVGRYRLLQEIGHGGFGSVWMAEQREPVKRNVALKIIKLGMDTRQVIARFEAERQALAMMDHPNIARVLDAGATESGRPFFVMELVKGVPITEYCDKNNLPTRQRLELFVKVCQAIQHAHQKGIIHRDIKPSNVLVTLHDGTPVPKVIDFGIAKATNAELTEKTRFTEFRQMVGTPAYMSPEQAEMSGLDIDTRSDIYSLGVLLYELLTGTTPFDPKELMRRGLGEIQRIIREKEPPRPSTRVSTLGEQLIDVARHRGTEPKKLSTIIKGDLDWIVMKAMDKDRTRRYQTASGLASDVVRHLESEPVLARPAGASYRFGKFVRRHKPAAVAVTGIAAALILGIVGTTLGMIRARASEKSTDQQKGRALGLLHDVSIAKSAAERDARRVQAANDFVQRMLSAAQAGGRGGRDVRVADVLGVAAAELDHLKDQPELELDGRVTLARTYAALASHAEATRHFERALALARRLYGPESEPALRVGAEFVAAGDDADAATEALARDTLATARRVLGDSHSTSFEAANALAVLLINRARDAEARDLLAPLVERVRGLAPAVRPRRPSRLFSNLATVERRLGHGDVAARLLAEAVELAAHEDDLEAIKRAGYNRNFASVLWAQGKLPEAQEAMTRSLEQHRQALGADHPLTLAALCQLIMILEQRQDIDQALALRQEYLKVLEQMAHRRLVCECTYGMGELLVRGGRTREGMSRIQKTLRDLHQWSATPALDADVTASWASASLLEPFDPRRPFASKALGEHAYGLCHHSLVTRGYAPQPLDSIDWAAARFRLRRWDGARARPGPEVFAGNLEQLRAFADPAPGSYLLSLWLPRRDADPVREAVWVLIQPWDVSLYTGADGRVERPSWQQLFTDAPARLTTLNSVCLFKKGTVSGGAGPDNAHSYAIEAQTSLVLPQGKYALHLHHGGSAQVWRDGAVWFEKTDAKPAVEYWTFESDGRPTRLALRGYADPNFVLFIEPLHPQAAAMFNDEVGPFYLLDAAIQRQGVMASRPWAPPALFRNYSISLLRRGRFEDARPVLAKAIQANPNDPANYYTRAILAAYLGDRPTHRADSAELIRRYADASAPELRERAAKAAILIPDSGYERGTVDRLIDGAVADGRGALVPWFTLTKGMIDYRAGRYESAVTSLERAKRLLELPVYQATAEYCSALALHKLDRRVEAKAAWDSASALWEQRVPKLGRDDLGDVDNWLIAQIVRREATQVFGDDAQPAGDRK
jgi:tetratricopeptide (TPR) repeat protein